MAVNEARHDQVPVTWYDGVGAQITPELDDVRAFHDHIQVTHIPAGYVKDSPARQHGLHPRRPFDESAETLGSVSRTCPATIAAA